MIDLILTNINLHYGPIQALHDISMEVKQGVIISLIGANGAGKTSTAKAIIGLHKISSGKITYRNTDISNLPAHKVNYYGISLVPEGRQLFPLLTVEENILVGAYSRKDKKNVKSDLHRMYEIFPVLGERKKQLSQSLSGGEQQMLAIARSLIFRPKFLILDEPSLGLAPLIIKDIFNTIRQINEEGTTIFLIEQNANLALSIAEYVYVLEMGSIIKEGTPSNLRADLSIKEAYLGT